MIAIINNITAPTQEERRFTAVQTLERIKGYSVVRKLGRIKAKHLIFLIVGIVFIAILVYVKLAFKSNKFIGQQLYLYCGSLLPTILYLFYSLFRSKTTLINRLNKRLQNSLEKNDICGKITFKTSGALSRLVDNLNLLLERHRTRYDELEKEKNEIYAYSKILEYKKERLKATLEKVSFGILVINDSNTVTFANDRIEGFTGTDKKGMIGHKFQNWSRDEDLTSFLSSCHDFRDHPDQTNKLEFTPKYVPGTTVSVFAHPLNANENIITFNDVTSEALEKKTRGEFVGYMSHELDLLRMYSEVLLGEGGKSEDFRIEIANVIHDEVKRLGTLINDLLSISNIEMGCVSLKKQQINPLDLLRDLFEGVKNSGRCKKLELKLELPTAMNKILVDRELMRTAINHLIINAVTYNRSGGSVKVSAEENSGQVIFRIQDTGIGIAQENMERIFEKFFRAENEEVKNKPGHGLGLPLAKSIIELHHGKLLVKSEINKGTEFTVILKKSDETVEK